MRLKMCMRVMHNAKSLNIGQYCLIIFVMSLRPTYYTLQIHATFYNAPIYQRGYFLPVRFNYLFTADSTRAGHYFFMWEKQIMGPFKRVLRRSRLFWPLKMVPSVTRGHFGEKKKLRAPQKPWVRPLFLLFTNKNKLVESAVHWYFYVPVAYILTQRAQKHHNLIEKKPQNGWFCTVPTVEAICENLPKRYKKSASSYHTQTGYILFLFKTHQFCFKPFIFCLKPMVFCLKPIIFCLKQNL